MDGTDRFYLNLWIGLAVIFALLVGFIFLQCRLETKLYVDAGYTRATLLGSDYPQWVLPEPRH